MSRLIAGLLALAVAPLVAAPVPEHLFPKTPLYFPTQVGTEWVYDDEGSKLKFVVTDVEEKDGAVLVTVGIYQSNGKTTQHFHTIEVTKTGLREVSNFYRKIDPPEPLLKWPRKKGDTWEAPLASDGLKRADYSFRCNGFEEITVPAGTFQTLRVEKTYFLGPAKDRYTSTTWYALDVGPVRIAYRSGSTRDLVKFTPGKGARKK